MKRILINILMVISIVFIFFNKYLSLIPLGLILVIFNIQNKKTLVVSKEQKTILNNEKMQLDKQIKMFDKKFNLLNSILINSFGETSITYFKYNSTISKVKTLFDDNVKNINLNFKCVDENRIIETRKEDKALKNIHKMLNQNKKILDKLDKLILELSKLDEITEKDVINNLESINDLIIDTKRYLEV